MPRFLATRVPVLLLLLALAFGGWQFLSAEPVKIKLPPETAKLKPGPGQELANAQCLICHSADYISTQPPLLRLTWKNIVVKMRDKYGAKLTDEQVETLADYLIKSYGASAMTNRAGLRPTR
jgi:sulfite dehydrogenase